jgi:polysaccharide biosynthesis protein PslH
MTEEKQVLLLTNSLKNSSNGGRQLLCKLNHDILRDIYGQRILLTELPRHQLHGIKAYINAFHGQIDGLSENTIFETLQIIRNKKVNKIFVDGSNLGGFVKTAKKKFRNLEITTFFHNVEARFFWGALQETKSIRAFAVLVANYLAERKAVKYSDKVVCLSERDSNLLFKVYGRAATHISAMALEDKMPSGFSFNTEEPKEKFALFVGGIFYANRAGIAWFVKHVVPRIGIKICIVGRGFEAFRHELERKGKVEVIGAVDHLADWYRNAEYVIAPIFDGSGMKTKVAEALMYGKKIIGTPEAFSGYEGLAERVGRVCSNADEFVQAIEAADDIVKARFDPEMRALYEKTYSLPAARARLEEIMNA